MLAIRLSAEDLAPDLIRLDKRLLDIDSPFVSLERELARLIDNWRNEPDSQPDADILAQADVLIAQARQQLHHLSSRAIASGSSLATAYLLERLKQSLDRLEALLAVLTAESSENEARHWLARITPLLPSGRDVLVGPGDDCAVLSFPDSRTAVSTDVLVEGHHFSTDWSSAQEIGARAAAAVHQALRCSVPGNARY